MWKALSPFLFLAPTAAIFVGWGAIARELFPNGPRRTDGLDGPPTLVAGRPKLLAVLLVLMFLMIVPMTLAKLTVAFLLSIPVYALALFILLRPPGRRGTE